jgi:hypothetical protein
VITLFIFTVALTPFLMSFWVLRLADARGQARLELALATASHRGLSLRSPDQRYDQRHDQRYVEGLGFVVGDFTCEFNARSPYLRCAVNPLGTCADCQMYREANPNSYK